MDISILKGKILKGIERVEDRELIFDCTDGTKYRMFHEQDCCESVTIDDINGNLEDLINETIIMAEESSNEGSTKISTFTWTFYRLATVKGYVNIKWYGESNGYYSEGVDFKEIG